MEAILLIATLTVICGTDNWTKVRFFGRQKQAWLETFLELPHGIPSPDSFGRACLCRVGAVTGRDTAERGGGRGRQGRPALADQNRCTSPLHVVSPWADAARPALVQRWAGDLSTEISAILELLELSA